MALELLLNQLLLNPEERPSVVMEAFGYCPIEFAYYLLGDQPWFDLDKFPDARRRIVEQTGTHYMPWVGRGYVPIERNIPEWLSENFLHHRGA